jgi:hypothetical protein
VSREGKGEEQWSWATCLSWQHSGGGGGESRGCGWVGGCHGSSQHKHTVLQESVTSSMLIADHSMTCRCPVVAVWWRGRQQLSPGRGGWRSTPVTPRGISGGGAAAGGGAVGDAGAFGPTSPSTARQRVATGRRAYVLDVDRWAGDARQELRLLLPASAATVRRH